MSKDSLFELISKEDVIIWVGSGFSLYAGFPSGQSLGDILIESLSITERSLINKNLPLPELAEEFYRLKGNNRNTLIKILIETFKNNLPKSTEFHDKLSIIPHFKTIITTNYDTLIEDALKLKGQVVISSKQIPYLEKEKTQIFKVHGDLSEPDSIIITKSDYTNFLKDNRENDVYWNVIKERLSTKNVLFLGYNLEDLNVAAIFDRITDALGSNRKECFLVSPNLPHLKVNDLINKRIQYLDFTGEEFISELIENLKENIIGDLEKGKTSADTFRKFLSNINILPDLKAEIKNYKVNGLRGTNDNIEGKLNFTLENDLEFINELNDYINGKKFGDFEISEKKLINADFWYGGLKFPNSEGISKIQFKSIPRIVTTIDIRFDDGFELVDIPVKLYSSTSYIEIHIELKNAYLKLNLDLTFHPETKVKFTYEHNEFCNKVNEEIDFFTLLIKLCTGERFTFYSKSGQSYSYPLPQMTEFFDDSLFLLNYFKNLRIIEQYYNVRFMNINLNSITKKTNNLILTAISVINSQSREFDWDEELQMDLFDKSQKTIEQFSKFNDIDAPVIAYHKKEEVIEIHGQKIKLGFKKVEFQEPYVSNLESLLNGKEKFVRIRSKNRKIKVSFTKTYEP